MAKQTGTTQEKKKGVKLNSVYDTSRKTDEVEYIKAQDLANIFPFTIYGGTEGRNSFGERIRFQIAYKNGSGGVEKKVLTLSSNDDRKQLLYLVRQNGAVTNCRLVNIHLGESGTMTYWKVIDADDELPAEAVVSQNAVTVRDEDIPF